MSDDTDDRLFDPRLTVPTSRHRDDDVARQPTRWP